ncbi:MAG: family 78 glycoside hydrolase catalytic domain [Clostridia bacterium]|nr:family 78 glycoside hydrolase catalytic domain [Clostridia bacterium]
MKFSTKFVAAGREYATFEKMVSAPCLRRTVELGAMKSAELTICGLGIYELFVNGNRITRGLLSPYLSNPDDILYYDCYNLKPYLKEGKNVIGVMLGNGMQNSFGGQVWEFETARWRSAPKLALTFEGETAEGEKLEFDAASGFKCAPSPIYLDDIRVGEFYDATKELPGWTKADYDDSAWCDAIPAETPRGECRLCDVDPILPQYTLKAKSIKPGKISQHFGGKHQLLKPLSDEIVFEYPEGEDNVDGWIYDFGVNAAGNIRLHIKNARPGQKLVFQFGEKLSEDGGLDLRGMSFLPRRYDHRDIYICKGGDESWMPMFTYHGFRYCLVTGLDEGQATSDLLTYVVMNTNMKKRASFHCSDDMANKLWDAVQVADLANFYHFPTDCPHREKNGWTADAALSAEQMLMSLSPERNYREWMHNIRKAMKEDGSIPGIIPTSGWGFAWGNGPAWDYILVALPYFTWLYRGDTTILKENATAIFRYINYVTTRRDERGLIHIGLGDWCPSARTASPKAPLEFTDTVVCMDICKKAAKIFEVLGMKAQQTFAETVWGEFRTAARKYLINTKSLTALPRCQTTQAMAIFYDVFDEAEKTGAFEQLVKLIDAQNGNFDCGVLGLRVLFHVLSEYGRTDLAYHMITKPEFPSYGYQIACGATSIWEDFRPDEAAPNSRNHHFFGDIISWFMKNLVGINLNPYAENVNEVRFAPKFIDALDNASGSHIAPAGEIKAEWSRDDKSIVYKVTVPVGMKAEVVLEQGWQFEDGLTSKWVSGEAALRIIPENMPDKYRRTAHA